MSGYFDGRNGRLSKTWRVRRCGKPVKTLRYLGDIQFEEICWNCNCCLVSVMTESSPSWGFGEFDCRNIPLQDDTPICHDCLGGEWNKQDYNKYTFTARLLGCKRLVTRRKLEQEC